MLGLVGVTAVAGLGVACATHLVFCALAGAFRAQRAFAYLALLNFLDSVAHRRGSRDFDWLTRRLASAGEGCGLLLLEQLDVAYLFAQHGFALWPEPYRSLAPNLVPLDPAGRVLYLDNRRLAEAMAADPACRARSLRGRAGDRAGRR